MPFAESAVGLAALGRVASPVVKELVSKSISYLGSNIADSLEDLETTLLPQFQLTIQAAQNSPHKDKLAKWLARLKNAYYDAEAILHDLEYELLKRRAKGKDEKLTVRISSHPIIKPLAKVISKVNKNVSPVIKPLKKITKKVIKKVSLLSPQKKRLWDQLNNLKKIAAEAKEFRDLLGIQSENGARVGNRTFDTSAHFSHKVFGRDEVRDQIIKFLLDEQGTSSTRSYSVAAITGVGGDGKTTLAQYVYNNEKVKKHFGVRMWLCFSENKDVKERTREMIVCASEKDCPKLPNLNVQQNKLIETLSEYKSILLVLDDVWYDDEIGEKQWGEKQWDDLLTPLASLRGRCKIMVTSRKTLFPNALEPAKLIKLSNLAPDDFKSLFRYYAIDSLEISDPQLKNDLGDIGDKIAATMSKSPLAAKVVGNELRKRPETSFWLKTLENDNLKGTREVLLWSYQHFDVQLQRCFLFCGTFPKGCCGSASSWFQYWVALDLIQSSVDRNVDDIGIEYFNMMVVNSIFQLVDGKFFMHDLFHDLAENLSVGDVIRVTNFENAIPSTTLYAYIEVDNENLNKYSSSICNLRNLRALILDIKFGTDEDINGVFSMVSKICKNLRVLRVVSHALKELPSAVGDLRNLRWLSIRSSSIEELPDSVSCLYHLQYLILPTSIKTLSPKLSDLIKLRSIGMYDGNNNLVNTLPPVSYLGKLNSLQSLAEFHVKKEKGYELWQLGSLREIAGSLRIVNLNNVEQKDEAIEARLIEKSKLKRLELVWAQSSENVLDLEVIEALQPATNLEDLSIEGYRGSRCPSWLLEGSILKNIKHLKFYNCMGLKYCPNFQSCHFLTELVVSKCSCLIFLYENELQLNGNEGMMEENSWLYPFMYNESDLKEIFDYEVQSFKLISLVQNYPELFTIERAVKDSELDLTDDIGRSWWHCHRQRMNFFFASESGANKLILPSMLCVLNIGFCCISDGALSGCLKSMTALKELHLMGIMTITTLPPAEILKSLPSLQILQIRSCWCLRSLGGLHALPSLEKFTLKSCWSLKMKSDHTELPPTLQSFVIAYCTVSESVLEGNLEFLQYIHIESCTGLKILSIGHITSLKSLVLSKCPRISHIQNLVKRPFIDTLSLVQLPDLNVESVLESWQSCRQLHISSSAILNKLLLPNSFDAIESLVIELCNEEISFEQSDHLQSIKRLKFWGCELQILPSSFSNFPNLESIHFYNCSRISSLPELPKSVLLIKIEDCPVLKERCQPNGVEWHKMQHIQYRIIK